MNLNMNSPKSETEDLILSITKNCETLIKQTQTKPQETFESKLTQQKQTFSLKPINILGLDSNCMIGLTNLEVYNSILNITEKNKKFELNTDIFDEFSFTELKEEPELILDIVDHTQTPAG